jgi:hypothetical protein
MAVWCVWITRSITWRSLRWRLPVNSFQMQTTDRAPEGAKQHTTHANCTTHGNWAAQERLLRWRYLLPDGNLRDSRTPYAIYISLKRREFILIQHRHRYSAEKTVASGDITFHCVINLLKLYFSIYSLRSKI